MTSFYALEMQAVFDDWGVISIFNLFMENFSLRLINGNENITEKPRTAMLNADWILQEFASQCQTPVS